jgi:hypothetical protein
VDASDNEVRKLFWDADPAQLDLDQHRSYIIERILSRGGTRELRWLFRRYGIEAVRDFVRSRGYRLPKDAVPFWQSFLELPEEQCTKRSSPIPSARLWPY